MVEEAQEKGQLPKSDAKECMANVMCKREAVIYDQVNALQDFYPSI